MLFQNLKRNFKNFDITFNLASGTLTKPFFVK